VNCIRDFYGKEKERIKMAEIIKTYKQKVPAMRFIGIKYGDDDRVDGMFGACWNEWFREKRFEALYQAIGDIPSYEDNGSYIGLMRWKEDEPFEYRIGMFAPEGADIPEGYEFCDFPKSALGVCWVKGKEPEVYMQEEYCMAEFMAEEYEPWRDDQGAMWFMERYGCPRFTEPDKDGNVILDICQFIK
jgi:predicted transcriptional regulator YdeE